MPDERGHRSDTDPGRANAPGFVELTSAPRERGSRPPPRPLAPPTPAPARGPGIRGGMLAGVAAGIVSGLAVAAWMAVRGTDAWQTAKMASSPFFGERALQPGFDAAPVLVGVVAHLVVCAAWGGLFGGVFYGSTRGATVALGALWGLVAWLAMHYGVLPLVGVANLSAALPLSATILAHVLFGLLLGLSFLPFQRVRRPLDWTA